MGCTDCVDVLLEQNDESGEEVVNQAAAELEA